MDTHIKRFTDYMLSQGFSLRTVKDYHYNIEVFVKWIFAQGIEDITDVTPDHIQGYQHYLYHGYKGARKKIISLSYQLNLLKTVKKFFAYLHKSGRLLNSPARDLELPRPPRSLPRNIMTKRDVKKILSLPDLRTPLGYRDRIILELLYTTGMRKEELRNIKLSDVDMLNREIVIVEGKGGYSRMIPITKKTMHYLEMYIQKWRKCFILASESQYLLLTNRGLKTGKNTIWEVIKKYCGQAKLKANISTHSFRHTCATHLLQGKASTRAIQVLLGHKCLSSTEIYTHVHIQDLKRLVDKHHPRDTFEC